MPQAHEPQYGRRTGEPDRYQKAGEVHRIVIEAIREQQQQQQQQQQKVKENQKKLK